MTLMTRTLITLMLACLIGTAQAQSFTYRGSLEDGGEPAQGRYDLRLSLYADRLGDEVLTAPLELHNVAITDGRFAVGMDFPDLPPGLGSGWLEVAVKSGEDANWETLAQRSEVLLDGLVCPTPWGLEGNAGTNPDSNFLGTTDNIPLILRVGNQRVGRLEPTIFLNRPNIVLGSTFNEALPDAVGATIAGGGRNGAPNRAGTEASVGGGRNNTASGVESTISGGSSNSATFTGSTVGGGFSNTSSSQDSSVVGGSENTASGRESTVSGGVSNCAGGRNSWAGGSRAKVRPGSSSGLPGLGCAGIAIAGSLGDRGTFVWADAQDADFISTGSNQFLVRASNGLGLNTNSPTPSHLTIGKNDGSNNILALGFSGDVTRWRIGGAASAVAGSAFEVQSGGDRVLMRVEDRVSSARVGIFRAPTANALEVNGEASKTTAGSWLANSDARIKTEVREIDEPLARLMRLRPVSFRYTDDYRAAHPDIREARYYNVIAQEFAEVFPDAVKGSGEFLPGKAEDSAGEILQVDTYPALITTIAAVQELAVRLDEVSQENSDLRARIAALESETGQMREFAERNAELDRRLMALEALLLQSGLTVAEAAQ